MKIKEKVEKKLRTTWDKVEIKMKIRWKKVKKNGRKKVEKKF